MVTAGALQQFLLDYRFQLKQAADGPLDMPPLTEGLFTKYERTGSRLDYETAYFTWRKNGSALWGVGQLSRRT